MTDFLIDFAIFNAKCFCLVFWLMIYVDAVILRIGKLLENAKQHHNNFFSKN